MFKNLSPGAIGIQASIEEGLALAKSAGFEGLDLNIGEASTLASEHSVDYVKNLWAEADLKMGGWGMPVNYRGSDAEFDESLSQLPRPSESSPQISVATVPQPLYHRVRMIVHSKRTGIFTSNGCAPLRRS